MANFFPCLFVKIFLEDVILLQCFSFEICNKQCLFLFLFFCLFIFLISFVLFVSKVFLIFRSNFLVFSNLFSNSLRKDFFFFFFF